MTQPQRATAPVSSRNSSPVRVIAFEETAENAALDQHGGTVLTDEDRNFIQAKAHQMKPANSGYRFFDAVGP